MKQQLIRLFWPILSFFESDEDPKHYKRSHRVILVVVGLLFLSLSIASGVAAYSSSESGAFIPAVVFFAVGSVSVVVGALGSNAAVSKIWGTK